MIGAVARQLFYFCKYTGLPAREFRHTIVGSKSVDPLNEQAAEAHIFTAEGSRLHKTFDDLAAALDIERKWDCKPEAGMPANLCYIVPESKRDAMEALTARLKLRMAWGVLPVPKTILAYRVPANYCWVITGIYVSTIPLPNNPDLTIGDWRSDYFDATGKTFAWLLIQGHKNTPENVTYFNLFNRPVLFVINGGARVRVQVLRAAFDVPASMNVLCAIQGFLAPGKAFDSLSVIATQEVKGGLP